MTSIEWTHVPDGKGGRKKGETLNPQVGCSECSPGCRNCYAARLAARGIIKHHRGLTVLRSNGPHWNGDINLAPDQLEKPLRWRDPRGIFWGSMTDIFHESRVATEEGRQYIAACFGVMAATPQHTHMVLTKRPHMMRQWFEWVASADFGVQAVAADQTACNVVKAATDLLWPKSEHDDDRLWRRVKAASANVWPLRNVWVGTSTEGQQWADERVPHLLEVPAVVRFLSAEPLLGPIDLSEWLEPVDRCNDCEAERHGIGEDVCDECGKEGTIITAWGRRQVERLRSGERYENDGPDENEDGPQIHWVIAGGESGPGARPMHPDWARSLRDQCVAAGVPFFFKQWGEYAPWVTDERFTHYGAEKHALTWVARDGSSGECWIVDGDMGWSNWTGHPPARPDDPDTADVEIMSKVGKGKAGRVLDGRTWDQFPNEE